MNNVIWWIILGVFILGTFLYQKKLKNDLLRKLFVLKQDRNEKLFFQALDETYTKFVLSKFSIGYMKYNYYLEEGNYDEAKLIFNDLKDIKTNNNNKLSLYLSMFNKAIEYKDNEFAISIKDKLIEYVNKNPDNKAKLIKGEINQLDKIYLKKDTSILPELILTFEQADNDEIIIDSSMKSTDCGYPWCIENENIISCVYYGYKDKSKMRKIYRKRFTLN